MSFSWSNDVDRLSTAARNVIKFLGSTCFQKISILTVSISHKDYGIYSIIYYSLLQNTSHLRESVNIATAGWREGEVGSGHYEKSSDARTSSMRDCKEHFSVHKGVLFALLLVSLS